MQHSRALFPSACTLVSNREIISCEHTCIVLPIHLYCSPEHNGHHTWYTWSNKAGTLSLPVPTKVSCSHYSGLLQHFLSPTDQCQGCNPNQGHAMICPVDMSIYKMLTVPEEEYQVSRGPCLHSNDEKEKYQLTLKRLLFCVPICMSA